MEDREVQLIAEQLARLRDNIESRFKRVETQILHNQELQKERNETMRSSLELLNEHDRDFEERIRELSKAGDHAQDQFEHLTGPAGRADFGGSGYSGLAGEPVKMKTPQRSFGVRSGKPLSYSGLAGEAGKCNVECRTLAAWWNVSIFLGCFLADYKTPKCKM